MKNKSNLLFSLLLLVLIGIIYREWFFSKEIIGGDWPYVFPEVLKDMLFPPSSWVSWQGNGLGGINPVYFLHLYQNFTVSIAYYLGIPWTAIYKIFWFGAFILISAFSSIYLIKKVVPDLSIDKALIAGLIFTTNTYILMVVGGGQMGVALAYAIVPFVLARFLILLNSSDFLYRNAIIAGLTLSAQVLFDPRISYITVMGIGIYILMNFKELNKKRALSLLASCVIVFLLHLSWILPLLLFHGNVDQLLDASNTSVEAVRFFSFASFSQSFSFLHPNWPENIFGKVGFMKPEFLLLPILAFSSLLFAHNEKKEKKMFILYFAILALVGSFLAKGANVPFGGIYLSAFTNIPGFIFFRDSTKFYVFVILAYSVLIPFVLEKISNKIFNVKFLIPALFIFFWLFTINPVILGQLGGTFKSHEVPQEYLSLKDYLNDQSDFFRTLWVPRQQRFTFGSQSHPAVEASPLFNATNSAKLAEAFRQKNTQDYLSKLGIKYVVIPYDSLGEIFLEDRKYDAKKRIELEESLDGINWLDKIQRGKITIYENKFFKDHFWLENNDKLTYKMISPVKYSLHVNINKPTNLIFSENYNPYWVIKENVNISYSKKTLDNLNSFKLNKIGTYSLEIYFSQESYYSIGRIISIFAFLGILLFLVLLRKEILLHN